MIRTNRSTALTAVLLASSSIVISASAAAKTATPPIRLSDRNQVPACATPERLDAFLLENIQQRGYRLSPPHRHIAKWYQQHGETHRVRWDYAFFQMALETNFLSFRRANGKRGDVSPKQNNFAGLGTTGGGIPGDRYPDASTGVLAQIQHLVVYSGERLANPVGHRTRLKQDVILRSIGKIARKRPVTFADLARRWAADRRYGRSIQGLARRFYENHCRSAPVKTARLSTQPSSPRRPAASSADSKSPALVPPVPKRQRQNPKSNRQKASCHIQIASFGGERAVLIESTAGNAINLTALNVHTGFESAMASNFIRSYAPDGRTVGTYNSRRAALAKAREICSQQAATKR